MLKLPMYALVGSKPVRIRKTEEGGMAVESWDSKTRSFVPDPTMMSEVLFPRGDDLEVLSPEAFSKYLK